MSMPYYKEKMVWTHCHYKGCKETFHALPLKDEPGLYHVETFFCRNHIKDADIKNVPKEIKVFQSLFTALKGKKYSRAPKSNVIRWGLMEPKEIKDNLKEEYQGLGEKLKRVF